MVGGRRALLAAAVLSLDAVLGDPLRARDDGTFNIQQNGSVNVVVTTAVLTKKPPPIPPLIKPAATETVATTQSTSLSIVFEAAPQQSDTQAGPVVVPTRIAAGPPQIPPAQLTGSAESASLNLGGGVPANTLVGVDAGAASPTSSEDEYPYPGIWGASGPLVTDVNAPTRSVAPSVGSVAPTSSAKAPPPFDPAGPAAPIVPPAESGGEVYGPGEGLVVTPTNTTTAAVVPTPPRGAPPKFTTKQPTLTISSSFDLGIGTKAPPGNPESYLPSSGLQSNVSIVATPPITTVPVSTPAAISFCQASDLSKAPTSYSIVYTSTITWVGDPSDYTPEYPPISTPAPSLPCVAIPTPARLTISTIAFCSSTGAGGKYITCLTTTSTFGYGFQTTTAALMAPAGTVIIITTDKNPAVVYSTPKPPNYGVTTEPRTRDTHNPATDGNQISTPVYNSEPTTSPMRQPPTTNPVTVAVKPTAVVINGNTIIDDPSGKTQVVVVSGVTFTIGPTQVIGGGATIDRPAVTGGVFLPSPTTTNLGGLEVVVSSSVAVVGGSSFTLGATPRTAVVSGQTVVISPTAVAVGSQTLTLPTLPTPTEEVVAGGDLITAIGQSVVVIRSTTITYGLSGTSTTVIDDDTIILGPGGVTAHGTTLGGTSAKPGATDYAVVGGATITKVGASVVVINGVTFTVGPGTGTTTTVVGGETITVGPDGISVSTLSLGYPFGPTTVITPGATAGDPTATSTVAAAKDMAAGLRPDIPAFVVVVCMAFGFMVLGV